MAQYNTSNPAIKRILREWKEMQAGASADYAAAPLEEDVFEWHFAIKGPPDTDFAGGVYHGRIVLPPEYPFKPPAFLLLTPNGRFATHTKVCLSISQHHPEHWMPSWSVRTALVALVAFLTSPANGAVGSLEWSAEERRRCAAESRKGPPAWGGENRRAVMRALHDELLRGDGGAMAEEAEEEEGGAREEREDEGAAEEPARTADAGAGADAREGRAEDDQEAGAAQGLARPAAGPAEGDAGVQPPRRRGTAEARPAHQRSNAQPEEDLGGVVLAVVATLLAVAVATCATRVVSGEWEL